MQTESVDCNERKADYKISRRMADSGEISIAAAASQCTVSPACHRILHILITVGRMFGGMVKTKTLGVRIVLLSIDATRSWPDLARE